MPAMALLRTGDAILHAVKNGTFHRNPKRKRGQKLRPSLTLRVTIKVNRVQYLCKENRLLSECNYTARG